MVKLYEFQKRVARLIRENRSVILQAPTGAGKTLASLLPFFQAWTKPGLDVPGKCVYSVPMRVLANQFTEEYKKFVQERLRNVIDLPTVAIQTGESARDAEFKAHLTFATIDQVLSSWLMHPYSLSKRMGNLNAGAFVGSYLVFDEFHLFDPDNMLPTTLHLLKTLRGVSPFVLMTATFSAQMLEELAVVLDAEPILLSQTDLDNIPAQEKERCFYVRQEPLFAEQQANVDFILERHEGQQSQYKRSLVILNQVERAQYVYEALTAAAPDTKVLLLHSRFLKEDRQRLEEQIRREFGKERERYTLESVILVATQVVEVGLDVTCQALHTELSPASSVLQRAGRCARFPGERGEVYVYPVEKYAPYGGVEARAQCERTWAWLAEHQGSHLSFADEQMLVNYAHGPTDQKILAQLQAGSFDWQEDVYALWRGEGNRAQAQRMIRNIQSQGMLVHTTPDTLLSNPFAVESFSLHPATVLSKFEKWQEMAEDDYEREPLPWAVCRLVEAEDEEEANRPVRYQWLKVRHKSELTGAPLLVVHPELVGYGADLGFTLYSGERYECELPEEREREGWQKQYRLETYHEHIRLVHEAFQEKIEPFQAAARRLERVCGWREGLLLEAAHLVVWLHDLGKLDKRWQQWARNWQSAIGRPHNGIQALAHTDYDSSIPEHRALDKKLGGKRPPHAVESALAAIPFLLALVQQDMKHPLFRAAFTAIARHHAPFSRQSAGYELVGESARELASTLQLLPLSLQHTCQKVLESEQLTLSLDVNRQLRPQMVEKDFLIHEREMADVCAYMLLVRALRQADQEGTRKGVAM